MLLILGLILLLAGTSWFTGATTVGWILFGFGCLEAAWWIICVGGFILTAWAGSKRF